MRHFPGMGHFNRQLHSSDSFSFWGFRIFLLWAAIICSIFCVVAYESFMVCLFSAMDRSLLAGKCLSMRARNCLPILVFRPE